MFENLPIVLASASPRRVELLKKTGITRFEILPSNVPETDSPADNAALKAHAVAAMRPSAYVIGADTVIRFRGEIIGKPHDIADAKRILAKLGGQVHEVVTGVCVCNQEENVDEIFEVVTKVHFKELTSAKIDEYLGLVSVLDKAGAYAIQEHGDIIISHIEGDYDNVIGLPAASVVEVIARHCKH